MADQDDVKCDVLHERSRLARAPLIRGHGVLEGPSSRVEGVVEFLLPVSGDPVAAIQHRGAALLGLCDFNRLTVDGEDNGRAFQMVCAPWGTDGVVCSRDGSTWALVKSLNEPVTVSYASGGPPHSVRALLNNFDYLDGDAGARHPGSAFSRHGAPLSVLAARRSVRFSWLPGHDEIHALLLCDLLSSSSLVEFTFDCWPGATESEFVEFASDIATACTYIAGDLTNLSLVDILDGDGHVVRRVMPRPVESSFIGRRVIPDDQIRRFFAECFERHQDMRLHQRWRKLASYCGTVEACATLEQRFASVATALEFTMRNALIERGESVTGVNSLDLPALIGRVRQVVGWAIPSHRNRWPRLRNSVSHGNERAEDVAPDNTQFRQEFDKLKLLLYRMALLELGYQGTVLAPHDGRWRPCPVDDFSEDRNSFVYEPN